MKQQQQVPLWAALVGIYLMSFTATLGVLTALVIFR